MPARGQSTSALLDLRFPGGAPFGSPREHAEALSLIRRLVGMAGGGAVAPSAAILEPLTGGRSAAHVFRVTRLFGADIRGPAWVIKLTPRALGDREKANYDAYVRTGLPDDCRPDLLGFARSRSHAGLCYSFVGGWDGNRTATLTDALQCVDVAKLDLVLRKLFEPMRESWYRTDAQRAESDLARRYLDRYFIGTFGAAEADAKLRACAAHYFDAREIDGGCAIGDMNFVSPHEVLFASARKRPYQSCILHGDLNTDNIVLGPDPDTAAMVDFQKTGRGHVYEDLAALEASIRINFPPGAPFGEILETERLIACGLPPPRANPYADSIAKIRAAAFGFFRHVEPNSAYHFAVAALGLRLMRATDLSHEARARIAASALWAAKILMDESQP